jgi:hypothetical protein
VDDRSDWEQYKRDRREMLKRHEEERSEMSYRHRAESECLIKAYQDARAKAYLQRDHAHQ